MKNFPSIPHLGALPRGLQEKLTEGLTWWGTDKVDGCCRPNTTIETLEHGVVRIGDLPTETSDYHVKCLDTGTGEIQFIRPAAHSILPPGGEWYELELEDGRTIALTNNHLVWLPELKCYRRVADLQEGDILLTSI